MFIEARTKGIVLASYDLNRADKIFICFTLDFGKIEIIGRGVKKSSSRLASHLESFIVSDFLIILGAKNYVLRSCFTLKNFLNLKRNLKLYFAASYLLELADKLTAANDPEPKIFFLLAESLNMLNKTKDKKEMDFILLRFQLKLLDALGFRPRFDACVLCHGDLKNKNMFFSVKYGGVICNHCEEKDMDSLKFTARLAAEMEQISEKSIPSDNKTAVFANKYSADILRQIGSLLVLHQLGKKTKSEYFIAKGF